MIFILDFDVPYDEWYTVLVTQNIDKALDCIINTEANSIKVWKDEELIEDWYFGSIGDYETKDEYLEDMKRQFATFTTRLEELNE